MHLKLQWKAPEKHRAPRQRIDPKPLGGLDDPVSSADEEGAGGAPTALGPAGIAQAARVTTFAQEMSSNGMNILYDEFEDS